MNALAATQGPKKVDARPRRRWSNGADHVIREEIHFLLVGLSVGR